jgi:probable HAF family extracellular repeat protein
LVCLSTLPAPFVTWLIGRVQQQSGVRVNNGETIVGWSYNQSPLGPFTEQTFHAFAYDTTGRNAGVMRALGTLGGSYAIAFAINERGDIVGESETASGAVHVFVWRDGVMIDLGALP